MNPNAKRLSSLVVSAALLLTWIEAKARVLDDFNDNVKTGWTDFTFVPSFGLPVEADGQFQFVLPAANQSIFTASTKSSETFTLQDGRTLEFRVDMVSGNGGDAYGVLGFIPASSSVSTLGGYGLAKSSTDIIITKGINKYFIDYDTAPVKNDNITLVLSLTGQGTSVIITGKVLDKDNNNAVLWEQTFVDTDGADLLDTGTDDPAAPYTGAGNVVLYCYENHGNTQPSYEVTFDNLEAIELDNLVLDNFDDNTKTGWEDFTFFPGFGVPEEVNGQFQFVLPAAGQSIFSGSTKTTEIFDFKDGQRLVFSADVVNANGPDAFAVLGYFPSTTSISTLSGYGLVLSSRDIIISKGINKYFIDDDQITVKNTNIKLVLSLEARGSNVVINGKVLDNDNNGAVLWDKTFLDTPGADLLDAGVDDPAAPYMGLGYYTLICYQDNGKTQPTYEVTFDNAAVSIPPPPANSAPLISGVQPAAFASFLPAATQITFNVADDKPLRDNGITVTLNGTVFATNNGLTVTGTGNSRSVSLGGLAANINYQALLQVVDSDNATNATPLYFDTFTYDNLVIEAEDYNFGGGSYIDAPLLIPEFTVDPLGYRGQVGLRTVDYTDTRTSPDSKQTPYRPADTVEMQKSLDVARQPYIDVGGAANGFYDYDVVEIRADEWLNYSRTFLPGTYEVYLREAVYNMAQSECRLERVTGDPTQPDATTEVLGSFLGATTGFLYRNFPLTDAAGQQKIVVSLSDVQTLRLRQVTPDSADGGIAQNYLVFIPAAGAGVQRPLISHLTPAPGSTVQTVSPTIEIALVNRDTSVDPLSINLQVNGSPVQPDVVSDDSGAGISYVMTPLPASGALNTARLVFADSDGVSQTNVWNFTITYKQLDPLQARPEPGSNPGFSLRMVQAPNATGLDNTVASAEAQLAPNSAIPAVMDTNTVVPYINLDKRPPSPSWISVPGLYDENGFSLGNGTENFAVEILAYLDLPAGVYRFAVVTDDGYKISSGTELRDLAAPPLAGRNGSANESFDFVVTQSGLYPFRMVYYQRPGDAWARWYSVDMQTGDRTLINDPNAPGAIQAYTDAPPAVSLESASTVVGPYGTETLAQIDAVAHTITVPIQGSSRFFRLQSATALHITGIQVNGAVATLTYE